MTLRTKTLTAVAALTISVAGFAMAQDGATTASPEQQPETAQTAPSGEAEAPASDDAATQEAASEDAASEDAEAEEPAAEDAAAQEPAAEEEPAADTPAAEEPAAEEPAAEEAEAPAAEDAAEEDQAADAAPDETVAEEEAAETLPADESADQPEAEEEVQDEPAPATDETAAEETEAQQEQPAGADAETAVEAESAEEPTVAEDSAAEDEEHAAEAEAEEHGDGGGHIEDISFSFEGPFGKYDQFQLQRGLQVYTEVCSACHGMKFVSIRSLADEGGPALPEDQVRAYAAGLAEITDEETGEDRPRLPTDHFPTVSGMGMGPDLSLMAKARAGFHGPYGTGLSQLFNGIGGPEYIHALLVGYTGEEIEQAGSIFYGNTAFPSGAISMPPPLSEDLVTYEDGTPATVDQMARDVSAFLMWTAEPKMMDRKMVGLVSVLFLIVLTALLYLTNKRLWAPHKHKKLER
jgi:ubiquinol-cytochrome c reductase cytochrome c1 subunit